MERTTHVKSPDSETPPKDETKEIESDTEPVGRFPSDAQHWIDQERGEDDHRAQEVHRAKREPPTPPMDTRRVQRARQEFQQQMQERQQKGHGKGAPTSAAEIDTDADDDSDENWGTWRDTHERAGPPAPGAFNLVSGQTRVGTTTLTHKINMLMTQTLATVRQPRVRGILVVCQVKDAVESLEMHVRFRNNKKLVQLVKLVTIGGLIKLTTRVHVGPMTIGEVNSSEFG